MKWKGTHRSLLCVNNNVYLSKSGRFIAQRRRAATVMVDTPSRQTRKIYDILAPLYPISSVLLHSNAHRRALAASGITNGMRVLEVAIGSGEMFDRILGINPDGQTLGLDLSPNMAAKTQLAARRKYRNVAAFCQAADARRMPFGDGTFDALVCCYLLELLSDEDIVSALSEFQRVLKPGGRLTLILIHQNTSGFNTAYKFCTRIAPAFWGRQVERRVPNLLRASEFKIESDHDVRQIFYPSRVIACVKAAERCLAVAAS